MTSCNRFDLLEQTLNSFLKYNTSFIDKYIFIEDTEKIGKLEKIIKNIPEVYEKAILLNNDPKLGQIKSIDKAYSFVETEYIFHCEEDWEFYKKGFIEDSIKLLEEDSMIINVWLRELDDTNKHPVLDKEFISLSGLKFRELKTHHLGIWHGFTFNPTVKRLSDYKKIGMYQNVGHEHDIGQFFFDLGHKAVIFSEGYLKHSGWHRGVFDVDKKRSKFQMELDTWFKKKKASLYKVLGIYGKKYK